MLSNYDISRLANAISDKERKELSKKLTQALEKATDKWLLTWEARKMLGVSERQLYKLRSQDSRIVWTKPNGKVYYSRNSLLRYLENR